jgi:hypothetical protein
MVSRRRDRDRWRLPLGYTPEGLGQNGADGLHGLEDGPCDMFFFKSM